MRKRQQHGQQSQISSHHSMEIILIESHPEGYHGVIWGDLILFVKFLFELYCVKFLWFFFLWIMCSFCVNWLGGSGEMTGAWLEVADWLWCLHIIPWKFLWLIIIQKVFMGWCEELWFVYFWVCFKFFCCLWTSLVLFISLHPESFHGLWCLSNFKVLIV